MKSPAIRQWIDAKGARFTDVTYTHNSQPAFARLHGTLTRGEAEATLASYRAQAARVRYVTN